jgi:DNA-binding MarR family transcriptional regulator
MNGVKTAYDRTLSLDDYEPKHFGYLLERVRRRMQHDLAQVDGAAELRTEHPELTPAYYRLLSLIPADGARITDLAVPAGMTKQSLGQFVDVLVRHGYARQDTSDTDRRVRIVRRTPRGDAVAARANALYEQLDAHWEDVLGPARLRTLKDLLQELAVGWEQ